MILQHDWACDDDEDDDSAALQVHGSLDAGTAQTHQLQQKLYIIFQMKKEIN